MIDKVKLGAAVLLVCAGVAGFYWLAESAAIIRVAVVLAGAILGAAVAWTSAPGKQFYAFSQEAVTETRKVVWPTRKESLQTTGIVFLFVVVMGIFLWLVDASLLWFVKQLMGRSD
jgi:preprotein translocase subunit SecE